MGRSYNEKSLKNSKNMIFYISQKRADVICHKNGEIGAKWLKNDIIRLWETKGKWW